mgnify:CR=1 FL=1
MASNSIKRSYFCYFENGILMSGKKEEACQIKQTSSFFMSIFE